MLDGMLWTWGLGVAIAWLALPLFAKLAGQSRGSHPATYHHALVWALGIGTALFAAPLLRGLVSDALGHWFAARRVLPLEPEGVVSEWMVPLVGSSGAAWPHSLLSRALSVLGGVWLLGLAFGVARRLRALWALEGLRRRALPAAESIQRCAQRIAREHGIRPPRLLRSSEVVVPFTCGILRPVVLLPPEGIAETEQELEFVLAHEIAHVARRDGAVAFGVSWACAAFALHPSARRLASEIAFAREASVDAEVAAAGPLEYARFLLASAERTRSAGTPWLMTVSMAETALSRRIDMLVNPSPTSPRSRRTFVSLAAAGLAASALACLAPASLDLPETAGAADAALVAVPVDSAGGSLPPELIQRVVRSHFGGFRACYDKVERPRPETKMDLHFVIGTDGRVRASHIDSQQVPELGECSLPYVSSLVFPAPEGGEVSVVYPVLLSPDEGEAAADPAAANDPKVGRLPPDLIQSVVKSHFDEFRACYEKLAEPRPTVTLAMHFTIGRAGRIDEGHVDAEEKPDLGRCAEQVMRGIVFPAPEGGVVTVSYPILFAPG
jgi:beta-lactamase regulating signal transducer with metallopeptidase domain